jgi:uncharacterized membrane-anchored protein
MLVDNYATTKAITLSKRKSTFVRFMYRPINPHNYWFVVVGIAEAGTVLLDGNDDEDDESVILG